MLNVAFPDSPMGSLLSTISERRISPDTITGDSASQLLATIVENATTEIIILDGQTLRILHANRAARDNLGYETEEMVLLSASDIKAEFNTGRLREVYQPLLSYQAAKMVIHTTHRRKDGTTYPVEDHTQITRLGDGNVLFQIAHDRTRIKAQLERSQLATRLEAEANAARSTTALLKTALRTLGRHFGCQLGHVLIRDAKSNRLVSSDCFYADGDSAWQTGLREASRSASFGPGEDMLGRVLQTRRSICVENVLALNDFKRRAALNSIPCSVLAIPLVGEEDVLAILEFFRASPFETEDLEHLSANLSMQISRHFQRRRAEDDAHEIRERFDAAMAGANVGLWDYNYQSGEFFLSSKCKAILNISDDSVTPDWKAYGNLLHPDDVGRTRSAMKAHILKRERYDVEYRLRRLDGGWVWLHVCGQGVWDETGGIVRTAGTLEDISAKKEADFVRREIMTTLAGPLPLQEKVKHALEASCRYLNMSAGSVGRVSGDIWEPLYEIGTGSDPEVRSRPLAETLSSEFFLTDDVHAYHKLKNSMLDGHPARTVEQVEAYIGTTIFVRGVRYGTISFTAPARRSVFTEAEIAVVRIIAQWIGEEIGRASDISKFVDEDRRKAATIASVDDGLLAVTENGVVEDANEAAGMIFGCSAATLRGSLIGSLVPSLQQQVLDGGTTVGSRQDIAIARDGERVVVMLRMLPVQLANRTLYTVALSDLRQVKQAEAAKRDFVSVVSHELRTPLTSIQGALALIANQTVGSVNAPTRQLIDVAQRNSQRLLNLVNDILDVEKLQTGCMEVEMRTVDLVPLLQEAVAAHTAYAEKFKVSLSLSLPERIPLVTTDPDRLQQVMANLLSNASKFTRAETTVELSVETGPSSVRVSVRDYGEGISSKLRTCIFDKFVQGESPNVRRREGSGLGLSITRDLMRLMKGDVGFVSEEGVGTTFYIDLPTASDEAAGVVPYPDATSAAA